MIDPGPDDAGHIDAIIGASMRERVRWVLLTHTHPDHAPGTKRLVKETGAEVLAFTKKPTRTATSSPTASSARATTIEGTEFGLEVLHTPGHAPEPPLLPPRGGARAVHRRHRPRRHVLGGQPEPRRRHGRLRRDARAAREAPALAARARATATSSTSRRPASASTSSTATQREEQIYKLVKKQPAKIPDLVAAIYGGDDLPPELDRGRGLAGARAPA